MAHGPLWFSQTGVMEDTSKDVRSMVVVYSYDAFLLCQRGFMMTKYSSKEEVVVLKVPEPRALWM